MDILLIEIIKIKKKLTMSMTKFSRENSFKKYFEEHKKIKVYTPILKQTKLKWRKRKNNLNY